MFWVILFYIIPLYLSVAYFTALKTEDIIYKKEIFTKDKYSYWKTICICFIPILNIVIVVLAIKKQFELI